MILSDEEQYNIVKEDIVDLKKNIKKILDAVDENSDVNVPLEDVLENIEDSDIKRKIKQYLNKKGENDE